MGLALTCSTKEVLSTEYYEDFGKKIDCLNEKVSNSKGLHLHKVPGYFRGQSSFAEMTQMTVEHMSQGALEGCQSKKATKRVIKILKKVHHFPDVVKKVLGNLNYLYELEKKLYYLPPSNFLIRRIKEDILKLQIGETILLPNQVRGHSMKTSVSYVECSDDNKKCFTIVQYNEGNGVHQHHWKLGDRGNCYYQVALEIKEIDGAELLQEDSHFIKEILHLYCTVEHIYKVIFQLRGKRASPSNDARMWSIGQLGGSCSFASNNAFVRSQLPVLAYEEFQTLAKTESLLKICQQIQSGIKNCSVRKIVALEIVKQLEVSGYFPASEWEARWERIKINLNIDALLSPKNDQRLRTAINARMQSIMHKIIYNLKTILAVLKSSDFTDTAIEEVKFLLHETLISLPNEQFTHNDYGSFIKIAMEIRSYCKKKPLNFNQIYLTTVIACVLLNVIIGFKRLHPIDCLLYEKEKVKLIHFCKDMHKKNAALFLNNQSMLSFDFFIDQWRELINENGFS